MLPAIQWIVVWIRIENFAVLSLIILLSACGGGGSSQKLNEVTPKPNKGNALEFSILTKNDEQTRTPAQFVRLGNKIITSSFTDREGRELVAIDLSTNQRKLLKDIHRGSEGSDIQNFAVMGSTAFFFADDGIHGREVWKTNGTSEGTRLLKDISPGGSIPFNSQIVATSSKIFFVADDGVHGSELWVSDGTATGTRLVKDIVTAGSSVGSNPRNLTSAGDRLIFSAYHPDLGEEIWVTDGTEAGTQRVTDLESNSYPNDLRTWGTNIFFFARVAGAEKLLTSDGTLAGTRVVGDCTWPTRAIIPAETKVYVICDRSLYVTTGESLSFVRQFSASFPIYNQNFIARGDLLYFSQTDGGVNYEPWISDGTDSGTEMLADISSSQGSYPSYFHNVSGGLVAFYGRHETLGSEIFVTDGTEAGTRLLKDIAPGDKSIYSQTWTGNSNPSEDRFHFMTSSLDSMPMLIESDGTRAGTRIVTTVPQGYSNATSYEGISFGDKYYFLGYDSEHGTELWETDFTPQGTALLLDMKRGEDSFSYAYRSFQKFRNGFIFATETAENTYSFFKVTDVNNPNLVKFFRLDQLAPGGAPQDFTVIGNKIYFTASRSIEGRELWVSDGTASGTRVLDLQPGSSGSWPKLLKEMNGKLSFLATVSGENGVYLTEGNSTSTRRIYTLPADAYAVYNAYTERYIYVSDFNRGRLWKVDSIGSESAQIMNDPDAAITGVWEYQSRILLRVFKASHGDEFYAYDPTINQAPQILNEICPGSCGMGNITVHASSRGIVFTAHRPDTGHELWYTDITTSGTRLIADLSFGTRSTHLKNAFESDKGFFLVISPDNYFSDSNLYRLNSSKTGLEKVMVNSEHARTNYCIYSDVDRLLCLGGFGDKNDGALVNVPYREMEFEGL